MDSEDGALKRAQLEREFTTSAGGDYEVHDLLIPLPIDLGHGGKTHDVIVAHTVEFIVGRNPFYNNLFGTFTGLLHFRPNGAAVPPAGLFDDDILWGSSATLGNATNALPQGGLGDTLTALRFNFPEPGYLCTQPQLFFSFRVLNMAATTTYFAGFRLYYTRSTIGSIRYAQIACSQKPL